jgi:DNA-binding IclR family transcriptional regulator
MACINPDGTLSPSARSVLESLQSPGSLAELVRKTGLPLYRIRMSLRELVEAGLLAETDGMYQATPVGLERLQAA